MNKGTFLPGNIPWICSVTAVLTASIGIAPVGLNFIALLITGQLASTTASIAPNLSTEVDEGELIISTNASLVITPSLFNAINSWALGVIFEEATGASTSILPPITSTTFWDNLPVFILVW